MSVPCHIGNGFLLSLSARTALWGKRKNQSQDGGGEAASGVCPGHLYCGWLFSQLVFSQQHVDMQLVPKVAQGSIHGSFSHIVCSHNNLVG